MISTGGKNDNQQRNIINCPALQTRTFKARALKTFDSEKEEFYPLMLEDTAVYGINTDWFKGDEIPCRASLAKIKVIEE